MMSVLDEVKDLLHKIVDATAGVGVAERLHGEIDALGAPAPAEPVPAAPEPVAEPFPEAPAEAAAPADPAQAWTAF